MGAGHHHGHEHAAPSPDDFDTAFIVGIALNLAFVIIEAAYGFAANSMALLADAGHNLSDVLGLVVAFAGAKLVKRQPSARFSYGLKKSSILAALINALLLLVAVGAIAAEAIRRLFDPQSSEGMTVVIVAGIGIVINALTAMLFMRGRKSDINIRGAYLHMVADALVSAGVVIAGLLIIWTGALWIDPVTSLVIAAVILFGTWGLFTEATAMTLGGTPRGIDPDKVAAALDSLPGVNRAHHLHIWALSTTEIALTVHLDVEGEVDRDKIIREANETMSRQFGIDHSTIQVERAGDAGCAEPDDKDCGH